MPASKPAAARAIPPQARASSRAQDASGRRGGAHAWGTTLLLAAVSAACFVLAFPPFDLWPLIILPPAVLAWMARHTRSTAIAVAAAYAAFAVMWLWLQRWMVDVSSLGYPALCLYLALFPALFVWIVRRVQAHPRLARWPMMVVVPVVWTGVECLRGTLAFKGYPWFLLAHPLINWPMAAQSADLLGTYFVGFLAGMWSGLLVDGAGVLFDGGDRRIFGRAAAATVVIWLANLGYGAWRLSETAPLGPGPTVLAIQTNLPQSNKIAWTPQQQAEDLLSFLQMTVAEVDQAHKQGRSLDLVVWPETMLPGYGLDEATLQALREAGDEYSELMLQFATSLRQVQESRGVPMLVGSPSFEGLFSVPGSTPPWQRHYNSAYLVDGQAPLQRYDKVFLTPFGETMPYISNWPWLEQRLLNLGAAGMKFDLDAAEEPRRLEMRWRGAVPIDPAATDLTADSAATGTLVLATPICFEDTVSAVCRRLVYDGGEKKAHLIVNLSNDGWFGGDDTARVHHAQIARFRCIENRVPMVRAVNTGCSVAIDSRGNMVAVLGEGRYGEPHRTGGLIAAVQLDARSTLFSRVGDLWAWLCLLLVTGGAAALAVSTMLVRTPARQPEVS